MLFINQSKLFVIIRVYVLLTTTWLIVKRIMLLLFGVDRRNLTFWFLMFTKMKFYKFHFSDYSEWPLFLCGKKNERKSWKTTSKSKYFYLNACSSWNDFVTVCKHCILYLTVIGIWNKMLYVSKCIFIELLSNDTFGSPF